MADCCVNGRQTILGDDNDMEEIVNKILSIISEQRVSLSQTRYILATVLCKIEDYNIVSL